MTTRVFADLSSGRIRPHTITGRHFAEAERLVREFGYEHRLRSLDAIQLAVAMDLQFQMLAEYFVTSDRALQDVAELVGLMVLNPQKTR